mgnify:CR=1 FL=1
MTIFQCHSDEFTKKSSNGAKFVRVLLNECDSRISIQKYLGVNIKGWLR